MKLMPAEARTAMVHLAMAFPCFDGLTDLEQPPNGRLDAGKNSVSAALRPFSLNYIVQYDQVGSLQEDCAWGVQSHRQPHFSGD